MDAHEQGGEADKGGCRGAGIGAPGVRHVGEHIVVRVLEGDAPLFVVADFFRHTSLGLEIKNYSPYHVCQNLVPSTPKGAEKAWQHPIGEVCTHHVLTYSLLLTPLSTS